ncbi:MAG: amidohydrolase [Dehalococcoidia bacterium]|nr:amidohydrolase [Dehalococcoidia bacterium]
MSRKYQVISADGHVETPPDSWVKYVPTRYRDRAPRLIKFAEGGEGWIVEGQPLLHNGNNITGAKTLAPGATEADAKMMNDSYFNPDGTPAPGAGPALQRLREQDADGIDCEVLFPPVYATRFVEGISDHNAYLAMVQAYNTFLSQDYCAVAPDRLIGNGVIPVSGIDDAVAELKRCKELGLRSVSFHQFPNGGGSPKPEDDRFWETALDLGVALSPHGNFGALSGPLSVAGSAGRPFATTISIRSSGRVYAIAQMIGSGVFERLPSLRIYIAETNASWMPEAFFMMDDSYKLYKKALKADLPMLPSEYVKKHFLFSFIRDPLAMKLRDHLPAENLMWGSDFPHSVGSFPHSRRWLQMIFDDVPESLKRKILLENPAEYFGLDLDRAITETPAAGAASSRVSG